MFETTVKLENLSSYLPYKLGLYNEDSQTITTMSVVGDNYKTSGILDVINIESLKPILRPLADLTKKLKFEGGEFIPAIALYPLSCEDTKVIEHYTDGRVCILENSEGCFIITSGTSHRFEDRIKERGIKSFNSYDLTTQLIKWNFDVFGLIEKGLVVDINNITA